MDRAYLSITYNNFNYIYFYNSL